MSVPVTIRKRIGFVFFVAIFLLLAVMLRLVWIQFIQGENLRQKAFAARFRNVEVKAKRGIIYDTRGRPLAISVSTDSFYAIPAQVRKADKVKETAEKLAEILEMDKEKVQSLITKHQAFVWIKRHVPDEQGQKIKALKLKGINYVEEPERFYPKDKLLAHILGFAGMDNQGLYGIEVSYDKELSGKSGTIMVEYDARGQEIPDALQKYIPPEDGNNIYLTIDETIQYVVERELDKLFALRKPKKAGVIVMEVRTGRILAISARPNFDPNNYQDYDPAVWKNPMISDVYEPGSTFKPVTAAGALEEGIVKPEDRFYCHGYIKVGKEIMRCWRTGRPHGSQTFVEGIRNSCNPVFISVGLKMGTDVFYRYLNGFGFGQKTGIELPGEAYGLVVNKNRAKEIDLASMAMGQANAVTPIQLITAFSAIANDGYLMKPQIVKEIRDKDGNLIRTIEPEQVRQVISKKTSRTMLDILETVVSEGTGKNAYIEGYRVGGKTGTAQKIIPGGGYSTSEYIGSFIGVAPTNDPKIAVLVVVDSPEGVYYGGTVAAPVLKEIVKDTMRYLQVPAQVEPDKITPKTTTVEMPNIVGSDVTNAVKQLENLKLQANVVGEGTQVKAQLPLPGSEIHQAGNVIIYTSIPAEGGNPESVVVPDLTGKTVGEVREITKLLNLNFVLKGSGYVVKQDPEPGLLVPVGTKITVNMEKPIPHELEPAGP